MRHPHLSAPHDVSPSLVRAELDRILASEIFSRSDRLSAFLRFIVDQTLTGHGDSLKEQVIAEALYGKGADFSTAADPIVRVDARRLRDKLREYYASAPHDPVLISVLKGSYTPVFELGIQDVGAQREEPLHTAGVQTVAAAGEAAEAPAKSGGLRRSWIAGGVLVLIGGLTWFMTGLRSGSAPPMRLLTVTSFPGAEEDPSLSPDGNFVAFSWHGPVSDVHSYIWVKAVDGDGLRRLTDATDVFEKFPAWSPDGRYIAFSRVAKGRFQVLMASALGGQEQIIAEQGIDPTWLPDSKSLVMTGRTPGGHLGFVHHVLETGARRTLTEAPYGFTDSHPRVSPDGTRVAFAREGSGRAGLFVVSMGGGEPTQIGGWSSGFIGGLSWTPDGREILFARSEMSGRRLLRVAVGGGEPAVAIPGIPLDSVAPSVSNPRGRQGYRLAFVSGQPELGLRMIDLHGTLRGNTITSDAPFCDATRFDMPGRFSPDGTQVAFTSDRSGNQQVWVAGRDGSGLRSVTHLQDATVNVGSWSPDGQWVAFDATMDGNRDIYVVGANGGPLKRLTDGKGTEGDPEWSLDGRWIYHASNASGRSEIWKMRADGSDRVQLTSDGGFDPRESPDGRSVYFLDAERGYGLGRGATLKRISAEGGPASVVYSGINPGAWEVTDAGIVFVMGHGAPMETPPDADVLAAYDMAEHRVRPLGALAFRIARFGTRRFLIVSRDGRWALASHIDRRERDVFVLDGFR